MVQPFVLIILWAIILAVSIFYSSIEAGKAPLLESLNGRDLGMFLISLGIFDLLQATIQHVRN